MKGAIIRRKLINNIIGWHYAIDVGDDHMVHFHPQYYDKCTKKFNRNRVPGIVTKDSKAEYNWETLRKPRSEHKADTIVKISLGFVGQKMTFDLLEWNCEHFTSFCFEAKIQSAQALLGKKISGCVYLLNTVMISSQAAAYAVSAATPTGTFFGSEYLGSLAVGWGVIAAPTAPAWVPVASGLAATAICGFVSAGILKWVTETPSIHLIQESNKKECIVCMENYICVRLLPCDHMILCLSCSKRVQKCPECRCNIKERVQIYKSEKIES